MKDPTLEPQIVIDSDLRVIEVPQELVKIAVEGDHHAETLFFTIPRYFDGDDLSTHSCIIRYINAQNEYGESETIQIKTTDDTITFGWLLDNYVTKYAGQISFTIQFETIDSDGLSYQWQTTPANLTIMSALGIDSVIVDPSSDLYRSLVNRIQALETKTIALETQINSITEQLAQYNDLAARVSYLEENVVYVAG